MTLETANITPRRPARHHKTISAAASNTTHRPESRMSIRSVSQQSSHTDFASPFKRPESAAATRRQSGILDGELCTPFKRPESAASTTRRTSGIPAPSDRRTSGIPAPRRQSGLPVARPGSPTRSTSSSSFHSDVQQPVAVAMTVSMGAPSMAFTRRQSGAQNGLGIGGGKSAIPMPGAGRKSVGSGIPVPR